MRVNQQNIIISMIFIMLSSPVYADIKLKSAVGFDTNPFQFNDDLEPVSRDEYIHTNASASKKIGNLNLRGTLINRTYRTQSDANYLMLSAKAQYGIKLNKKQKLYLSLRYNKFDGTYVSRFTGDVFSFSDTDAGDRYDYQRWTPSLYYMHYIGKKHRFTGRLSHRIQNYKDFTDIGLSDLDYRQTSANLTWRYRPNKRWRFTPYIDLSYRDYDNRLAKAANGDNIEGSSLAYKGVNLGLKIEKQINKQFSISSNLNIDRRKDNASGYFDRDSKGISLKLNHETAKNQLGHIGVDYVDIEYNASVRNTEDESENITPSRTGWRYQVQYQWPIKKLYDNDLTLKLQARHQLYESQNAFYQFNQTSAYIGLGYQF